MAPSAARRAHLGHAGHERGPLGEALVDAAVAVFDPAFGQHCPHRPGAVPAIERCGPDEIAARLGGCHVKAKCRQVRPDDFERRPFAVDEDAVAIEKDRAGPHA